jgi:methylisocitrate lyase
LERMQHRSGLYRLLRYADYNEFDTETYNFTMEETDHDRTDR